MLYRQDGEKYGIGATRHFIELGDKNILIDSGMGFKRNGQANEEIVPAGDNYKDKAIDLILVTHHHIDHVGTLPKLAFWHQDTPIVMSETAFTGMWATLTDGLKIGERKAKQARQKGKTFEPMYNKEELGWLLNEGNIELIESSCWFSPWSGWKIGIHPNGHNPGSRMYFLSPPNDRPVIITGDISRHDQEIVRGVFLPNEDFMGDFLKQKGIVLITEGTNGARAQKEQRNRVKEQFIEAMLEIKNGGGQVFCPAFSSNRAANITAMCVEAGIVPHIDGLARDMLSVELPDFRELVDEGKIILFENGNNREERSQSNRHRRMVAAGEDPCGHEFSPIVSPQATLDFGFAVGHAERFLPQKRNGVFFTGHIFEKSKAEEILKIKRGRTIKLNGLNGRKKNVNVRCEVSHFDFTGHDYQGLLAERICAVNPKYTIVHHCEKRGFYGLVFTLYKNNKNTAAHEILWGKHQREFRL